MFRKLFLLSLLLTTLVSAVAVDETQPVELTMKAMRPRRIATPVSLVEAATQTVAFAPAMPVGSEPPNVVFAASPEPTAIRLPIIEYHYSYFSMGKGVSMKPEWFDDQLRWLSENNFTTLTAEQLATFVEGTFAPPQRSVVLTFDVGGSKFDDYENVIIPALRQYGFHAIFFVLASRTLDECDGENACWPRLAEWQKEGVISVGSHSWSHIDYTTMSPEQIAMDAGRSKKLIEKKIGQPALGICYPFDSPNPAAFSILETLGYKFAVGGHTRHDRSVALGDPEPYNLPRYYPYSGDDFYPIIGVTGGLTFEEMVLGAIK
ncbi:MAG: polysaccharide deacetylase family protein [Chloroflexi bacterium]|nr:polysaccharide deacetylase family protein [Chloroflexota bacterium]